MRRILEVIMVILIFFSGFLYLSGEETAEQWDNIYRRASTLQQKYDIMLSIIKQDRKEMIPTLISALEELLQNRSFRDKKDAAIHEDLQRLIIQELGRLKASDASDVLYRALRQTRNPYMRGDIILALGQIGAAQYASYIAGILKDVTAYKGEDLRAEEALAFSCIYALEQFKDPVGYMPIFLAYHSGFSKRVKDEAEKALSAITNDPTEILMDVLVNEPEFSLKLQALRAEKMSKAPDERKMAFATEALRLSLVTSPKNIYEETSLRDMRLEAMTLFIELGKKYEDAVKYIEQIIFRSKDITEKMIGIEVLGSFGGEESAKALVRYLAYNNDRRQEGVPPENNLLIISVIRAIERTGSKVADEELLRTKYVGYPQSIVREVNRVLESNK